MKWTTALAACGLIGTAFAAETTLPDLTSYALVRNDTGAQVSVDEAADILAAYDVVFIGEAHEHPGNHLAEMALLRAVHQRAPNLSLSMEQFERNSQGALDEYLAGKIGEGTFTQRTRARGTYTTSYRPMVKFAKDHKLPVIAGNAPSKVVRCVGMKGAEFLAQMKPKQRGWAAAELNLQDGAYKDKFLGFAGSDSAHGGEIKKDDNAERKPPSAQALRGFAAQVTRDDTMAESITLHLGKNPDRKVVHINGSFHSEGFLGTVERLQMRMPALRIAVVNPEFTDDKKGLALSDKQAKGGTLTLFIRPLPAFYATDAEMSEAIKRQMEARKKAVCEL